MNDTENPWSVSPVTADGTVAQEVGPSSKRLSIAAKFGLGIPVLFVNLYFLAAVFFWSSSALRDGIGQRSPRELAMLPVAGVCAVACSTMVYAIVRVRPRVGFCALLICVTGFLLLVLLTLR